MFAAIKSLSPYFFKNRNSASPATPNIARAEQLIPSVVVQASILELLVESHVNGLHADVSRDDTPGRLQYHGHVPDASVFTAVLCPARHATAAADNCVVTL